MPDNGGRKGYGNVGTPNGDSLHKSQEIRSVMLSWIHKPGERGLMGTNERHRCLLRYTTIVQLSNSNQICLRDNAAKHLQYRSFGREIRWCNITYFQDLNVLERDRSIKL